MDIRTPPRAGTMDVRDAAEKELKRKVAERLESRDPADLEWRRALIVAILKWIEPEELWMACEELGMVKAGVGVLITPKQMAEGVLEHMRADMTRGPE